MKVYITEHARERILERIPSIKMHTVDHFVSRAWDSREKTHELTKRHKDRRNRQFQQGKHELQYRTYGGYIFCFQVLYSVTTREKFAKLITIYKS